MSDSTTVIVGGGVIGLSTAYHLAQKGSGPIILLDKGKVGEGASIRAAGIVSGHMWVEAGVEARKISLRRFRELSDELDDYTFQQVGTLGLFDPPGWEERQPLLALYDQMNVAYEVLDADAMHERWPHMTPCEDLVGLFDPHAGYSEPDHYVPALANKARELGVDIREHQQVTGFINRSGHIAGVTTKEGDIEGDAVVCTSHVWAKHLLATLGWQLPLKNFVHQRFVSQPLDTPLQLPALNATPLEGYIRPHYGDRLLVGLESCECEEYRVSDMSFDMSSMPVPDGFANRAGANLQPLVPMLKQVAWESEHIGVLCFTIDGEPVLGPVSHLPGLYLGMAFHSGGFAYNPAAGVLLAEYVAEGKTSIDVSRFSPDRFKGTNVEEYVVHTVTQSEYGQGFLRRRH